MALLFDILIRLFIFVPATLGTLAFLIILKPNMLFTFLSIISVVVGIGFYYAVISIIEYKSANHYIGCRVLLQEDDLICSCGAKANMFVAENESEETRVIIQCSDNTCCASIQAYSITSAKLGWDAIS